MVHRWDALQIWIELISIVCVALLFGNEPLFCTPVTQVFAFSLRHKHTLLTGLFPRSRHIMPYLFHCLAQEGNSAALGSQIRLDCPHFACFGGSNAASPEAAVWPCSPSTKPDSFLRVRETNLARNGVTDAIVADKNKTGEGADSGKYFRFSPTKA